MKCTIPEISWHNRDPVLSVDVQNSTNTLKGNEGFYRLATGGTDSHVLIWMLTLKKGGVNSLECAADLTRHTKPVNCVRFSPSGEFLASGDDESYVIIWKMKTVNDPVEFPTGEEENFREQWSCVKILRSHLQDVYDLSWSADSKSLISGSVDNTAILWSVDTGKRLGMLTEHKGFVQGVAWDPCGQFVATMSSDRVCRVFNTTTCRAVSRMSKGILPGSQPETKPTHIFYDDTLKSFFRRLTFTPDGELLIVPSGIMEEPGKNPTNTTVIFSRHCLNKPVAYLPSLNQYTVAVRCCPVVFTLRQMQSPALFDLPYRVVIAVATQCSVMLYDTQHAAPFAFVGNIHYTRLTDLSWSSDGRVLVVSSTDGYCSVVTFAENELGTVYTGELRNKNIKAHTPVSKKKPKSSKSQSKAKDNANKSPVEDKQATTAMETSCNEPKEMLVVEDANMPFESLSNKSDEDKAVEPKQTEENHSAKTAPTKSDSASLENEVPMEVDDFHLVYEGTLTEPVLEPTPKQIVEKKSDSEQPNVEAKLSEEEPNCERPNLEVKPSEQPNVEVKPSEEEPNCERPNLEVKPSGQEPNCESQNTTSVQSVKTPNKSVESTRNAQDEAMKSPIASSSTANVTPVNSNIKTPRRVQLITLSSPKSKKKLL